MDKNIEEEKIKGIDFTKIPKEHQWLVNCGLITENGLRIDGLGVLMSNSKKTVQFLDKLQRLFYFFEKRQKNWHQEFQKINHLQIEQDFETKE